MKTSIHIGSSAIHIYLAQIQEKINNTHKIFDDRVHSQNQWLNTYFKQVQEVIESFSPSSIESALTTNPRKRSSRLSRQVVEQQNEQQQKRPTRISKVQPNVVESVEAVISLDDTDHDVEVVNHLSFTPTPAPTPAPIVVAAPVEEQPRRVTRSKAVKAAEPVQPKRLTRAQQKKLEEEEARKNSKSNDDTTAVFTAPTTNTTTTASTSGPKRRLGARATTNADDNNSDDEDEVMHTQSAPVIVKPTLKTVRGAGSRANSRQRLPEQINTAAVAPVQPATVCAPIVLESPVSDIDSILLPEPNVAISPANLSTTEDDAPVISIGGTPASPGSRFKICQSAADSDSDDEATPLPYNSSPVFHLQLSQPPTTTNKSSPSHIPMSPIHNMHKPTDVSVLVLDASQDAVIPMSKNIALDPPAFAAAEVVTPSSLPLPTLAPVPDVEGGNATRKPTKAMALIAAKAQEKGEQSVLSMVAQKIASPLSWFSTKKVGEEDLPTLEAHSPTHIQKQVPRPQEGSGWSDQEMFSPVKSRGLSTFSDTDEAFLREIELNMKSTAILNDLSAIGVDIEDFELDEHVNTAQARASFEALAKQKAVTPKMQFGKSTLSNPNRPVTQSLSNAADAKKKASALLASSPDAKPLTSKPGMKFNFAQEQPVQKALVPASSASINAPNPLASPMTGDKKTQSFLTPKGDGDPYAKNLHKMLRETTPASKKENNFEIVDREDSDDDDDDYRYTQHLIPDWARSMASVANIHKTQLLANPDAIFPPLKVRSCDLEAIFKNFPQRKCFRSRTSSGMWQHDGLTLKDVELTNKKLRIQDYQSDF